MTLNWAELQQLGLAIAQASDEKLVQIVRMVDTLPERTQLDDAIAKVRHRLFWLKPPRPLSMARILFSPVEDLLDTPLRYRRGTRRFNRAIIRPVVDLVESGLGAPKAAAVDERGLWASWERGDLAAVDRETAILRSLNPGWTPPARLTELMDARRTRDAVAALSGEVAQCA